MIAGALKGCGIEGGATLALAISGDFGETISSFIRQGFLGPSVRDECDFARTLFGLRGV